MAGLHLPPSAGKPKTMSVTFDVADCLPDTLCPHMTSMTAIPGMDALGNPTVSSAVMALPCNRKCRHFRASDEGCKLEPVGAQP